MTTFILRSSNLEWQEKEPIICGRVCFKHKWNLSVSLTHIHTYIFVAFLETGNKNGYSFTSVMKKKMWTNVITRWFSQMHQVENNDNTILNVLVSKDQIEHLRRSKNVLNLEVLCIIKLKALFSKYLSNPFISSRVPTAWTYNCSLTQLF